MKSKPKMLVLTILLVDGLVRTHPLNIASTIIINYQFLKTSILTQFDV